MSLLDALETGTNRNTLTENGAITNDSSLSSTLDFFSLAGAMRERKDDALDLFKRAFAEDKLTAVRILFYLRDVRGGQGERDVFRHIFSNLDRNTKLALTKFIDTYGRWDDIEPITDIELIQKQLKDDENSLAEGKSISLLSKWLPSANSSSKNSRKMALNLAAALGLTERQYRQKLSKLRKHLDLLESKMSAKQWSEIDYSKLPTQAHRKHVKAFKRNDEARYEEYLGKVEKGEAKINSNTAFTYEIYDMVMESHGYSYRTQKPDATMLRTADAMWKALPNYTNDENALVLADVSGSMTGRPMSISVSLATYFAERNRGTFKDHYLSFTDVPRLIKVQGNDVFEKFCSIQFKNVGYGTDLQAAFRAVLSAAKQDNTPQKDMPKVIYIISDMEFNSQMSNCGETNFETAQREFKESGYELPHIVFWNVNARQNQAPATKYDNRVTLISGSSQSTFQYAVAGKTPLESMLDIVNGERYNQITL